MLSTSMLSASLVYLIAFYAQAIFGLTVTSPAGGDLWNPSSPLKVQWSSVSTDPSSFDVKISNQDANTFPTGFSQDVKKGVSASDGSISLSDITGLKDGPGYTVNLISGSNGAILAQSQPFNVSSSGTSQGSSATNSSVSSAQGSSNATTSNATTIGSVGSTTASNISQHMNTTGTTSLNHSSDSTDSSSKPTSDGHMLHPVRIMGFVLLVSITMLF
ncbi:secreted protein [Melampsora americana]|nr:secreted protein [Melampsora americana]